MTTTLRPGRLRPRDVLRVGGHGLRARPVRVVLSALGIAIGIAAMVAVVGISTSSRAELNRLLDALGTNLLTAAPGTTLFGEQATLPDDAVAMVGRIGPVESVSATGKIADAKVYRSDKIPPAQSGGIATLAARTDLPEVVGATLASGTWLNTATAQYPAVVLGAKAAEHLGIGAAGPDLQIWLGGRWVTVVGTLQPVPLAPELDQAVLIGWQAGRRYLGFDGDITTVYTRTDPDAVKAVRELLARTVNPAQPNEVEVSRPSDALAAQAAADVTFTGLLLDPGPVPGRGPAAVGARRRLRSAPRQRRDRGVCQPAGLADRGARLGHGRRHRRHPGHRRAGRPVPSDPRGAAGSHRGTGDHLSRPADRGHRLVTVILQ